MSTKPFDGIARITSTVATKSVLNPTLILAAIVVPLCLLLGFWASGGTQQFLFGLAGLVISVAIVQIIGFSIFRPDDLQDNKHSENKLMIAQLAQQLGDNANEILIDNGSPLVNNPAIKDKRDV